MYLHEMEAGKPKPALPEDVAKMEARAKSNPSLRPPSKPPPKASSPVAGVPVVKMLKIPAGSFDFAVYYDCQEEMTIEEPFCDSRGPPELSHVISETGDINPTMRTTPCRHMWRTMKTIRIPLMQP